MSDLDAAQLESQSIIANLRKGQEELMSSATAKKVKPMNFAWSGMDTEVVGSETAAAFPVYPAEERTKSFRPQYTVDGPFSLLSEYGAGKWKTESASKYLDANPEVPKVDITQTERAGFPSFKSVDAPSQFSWKLLDEKKNEGKRKELTHLQDKALIDTH